MIYLPADLAEISNWSTVQFKCMVLAFLNCLNFVAINLKIEYV